MSVFICRVTVHGSDKLGHFGNTGGRNASATEEQMVEGRCSLCEFL